MRLAIAAATLAVAVAACGPSVTAGYVTSKRDVPAHDDHYIDQVYTGQTCTTTKVGKTTYRTCTNHYVPMSRVSHVERACYVTLQGDKATAEAETSCDGWDAVGTGQYVDLKGSK